MFSANLSSAGGVIVNRPEEGEPQRLAPNAVVGYAELVMRVVQFTDEQGVPQMGIAIRWPQPNSKTIWRLAPNSQEWLAGAQPITNKKVQQALEDKWAAEQAAKANKSAAPVTPTVSDTAILGGLCQTSHRNQ